jgi:hypothetical protein
MARPDRFWHYQLRETSGLDSSGVRLRAHEGCSTQGFGREFATSHSPAPDPLCARSLPSGENVTQKASPGCLKVALTRPEGRSNSQTPLS